MSPQEMKTVAANRKQESWLNSNAYEMIITGGIANFRTGPQDKLVQIVIQSQVTIHSCQ